MPRRRSRVGGPVPRQSIRPIQLACFRHHGGCLTGRSASQVVVVSASKPSTPQAWLGRFISPTLAVPDQVFTLIDQPLMLLAGEQRDALRPGVMSEPEAPHAGLVAAALRSGWIWIERAPSPKAPYSYASTRSGNGCRSPSGPSPKFLRTLAQKGGTKKGSKNPLEPLHWNGSGRQDSNLRPSAPKAPALPSCATPRREGAYPPPTPVAGLHHTVQR